MDVLRRLRTLALALLPHPKRTVVNMCAAPSQSDSLPGPRATRDAIASGQAEQSGEDKLDQARVADLVQQRKTSD
ncbi:MAG: hypothetical protein AMJ93_15745 [Anaerolineae bacterium SM23_84]|nr:MAG: hypothetical protein AMJ93_15745 [Anaerolineae bacterium SM23_84]